MPGLSPADPQDGIPHEVERDTKRFHAKCWIARVNSFFAVNAVLLDLVMTSDALEQFRKESHLRDRFGAMCSVLSAQLGATLCFALMALYVGRNFKQLLQKQRGRCVLHLCADHRFVWLNE